MLVQDMSITTSRKHRTKSGLRAQFDVI